MPEFLSKANADILKFNRKIFVPSSNLDSIILIQSQRVPEVKLFYRILGVYKSSRTVPPRSSLKIHIYFHLFKLSIGHNFSQFVIVILVLADVFTYNIQSKYLQLQEFEKFSIILKEIKPITRFYNKFFSKLKISQFKARVVAKIMVSHFFPALTKTYFSPWQQKILGNDSLILLA